MNKPANDNRIVTTECKLQILTHQIEKMRRELANADGRRKKALLKLIGMGQRRVAQLKRAKQFLNGQP